MNFFSIKDPNHIVSFAQAIKDGLAPNQGLYYPTAVPVFDPSFFETMPNLTLPQLASKVLAPYVMPDLNQATLDAIVNEVFDFPIPLVEVEKNVFALELFHGPTLAFKDIGARFLAQSIRHLNKDLKIRVLVATSGDTGSAVANGFLGVEGTEVIVLYPKGKVSELQQKQFASLGQNIKAIAIEGTFDDCQRLVKSAFSDESINKPMNLTSANSINVARWVPQSVYYYWAVAQAMKFGQPISICVPSGNLGNITSGLLALKTGLPVQHFVASSNANHVVPEFLRTGLYQAQTTIQTLANAMDVGDPNNFPRLMQLFGHNVPEIQQKVTGFAYSDTQIADIMRDCYKRNHYILDPHGATGFAAIKKHQIQHGGVGVFLETAHPGKFVENVEAILEMKLTLPIKLQEFAKRTIKAETLPADYSSFKNFLTNLI